jgi:pimeloyl-ACP methyl ester carboxylesterase
MTLKHEAQATGQLEDVKYPENFPDWVDRYKVQMQFKGFRNSLASTVVNYSGDSIIANYKKMDSFKKEILLIWGKEDVTTPFAQSDSLNRILHTQFFPVENARHLPHLEYPGLVNSRIISFLK